MDIGAAATTSVLNLKYVLDRSSLLEVQQGTVFCIEQDCINDQKTHSNADMHTKTML